MSNIFWRKIKIYCSLLTQAKLFISINPCYSPECCIFPRSASDGILSVMRCKAAFLVPISPSLPGLKRKVGEKKQLTDNDMAN